MLVASVLLVWRKGRGVRADMKAWAVHSITVPPGLFVYGDRDLSPITKLTRVQDFHKEGKAICFPCVAKYIRKGGDCGKKTLAKSS